MATTTNMTHQPNDYDQYYSYDSFIYKNRIAKSELKSQTKSERELLIPISIKESNATGIKKSESKTAFSLLTRATSFMTWDTTGSNSKVRNNSMDTKDEESQAFSSLLRRKYSIHSLSGMTIMPTIYGSTHNPIDEDSVSECTYVTGAEKNVDDDSALSYDNSIEDATSESKSTIIFTDSSIENIIENDAFETKSSDNGDVGLCVELSKPNENVQESDIYLKQTLAATLLYHIISSTTAVQEKSRGLNAHQAAPRFPISECIWTFCGSFTIIFILCFLSTNITLWNDDGHAFPLGPFGALTTLQYSIVNAPPAQPRNVLLGSTLSGVIAVSFTYIPETILTASLRIALATSISIASMAALGIMHPPGGAIALVFSVGGHHWGHLLLTLIGCAIAVVIATIINNLNNSRQYPQYWDFTAPFKMS